jgi:hypothetical protein
LFHPSLLDNDTNRLKEFLHEKIAKRKKQIHPAHNIRFNHDLQLEIDCIEWAFRNIEVNKIPNDRLEAVIRSMIKDLEIKLFDSSANPESEKIQTFFELLLYNPGIVQVASR